MIITSNVFMRYQGILLYTIPTILSIITLFQSTFNNILLIFTVICIIFKKIQSAHKPANTTDLRVITEKAGVQVTSGDERRFWLMYGICCHISNLSSRSYTPSSESTPRLSSFGKIPASSAAKSRFHAGLP